MPAPASGLAELTSSNTPPAVIGAPPAATNTPPAERAHGLAASNTPPPVIGAALAATNNAPAVIGAAPAASNTAPGTRAHDLAAVNVRPELIGDAWATAGQMIWDEGLAEQVTFEAAGLVAVYSNDGNPGADDGSVLGALDLAAAGKFYWELYLPVGYGGTGTIDFGLCRASAGAASAIETRITIAAVAQTLGVAYDASAGRLWVREGGVWSDVAGTPANPVAGTGGTVVAAQADWRPWFRFVGDAGADGTYRVRLRTAAEEWVEGVPAGFGAIAVAPLPTPPINSPPVRPTITALVGGGANALDGQSWATGVWTLGEVFLLTAGGLAAWRAVASVQPTSVDLGYIRFADWASGVREYAFERVDWGDRTVLASLRHGTDAERLTIVLEEAEPFVVLDDPDPAKNFTLWIGDGATMGGQLAAGSGSLNQTGCTIAAQDKLTGSSVGGSFSAVGVRLWFLSVEVTGAAAGSLFDVRIGDADGGAAPAPIPGTRITGYADEAFGFSAVIVGHEIGAGDVMVYHVEQWRSADPSGTIADVDGTIGWCVRESVAGDNVLTGALAVGVGAVAIATAAAARGHQTTASGQGAEASGELTVASGTNSRAHGANTLASGVCSEAGGSGGRATITNEWARGWANGSGSSLFARFGVTTNATPLVIALDTLPAGGTVWAAEVTVLARQGNADTVARFVRRVVIRRKADASVSLVGAVETIGADQKDAGAAAWTVALAANNTTKALDLTVTGAAATSISWTAEVRRLGYY